jgi:hypothetical protein
MRNAMSRAFNQRQRDREDALPCSICGHPIAVEPSGWREGHNAEPVVKEGRCCASCNQTVVIPKRLARFTRSEQEDRLGYFSLSELETTTQEAVVKFFDEWQAEYDLHHPELVDPMKEER